MAPTQAAVHRAWLSIAQAWPKDPLRPNHQFGAAIGAAAQRIFDHPAATSPLTQAAASTSTSKSAVVGHSGRPVLNAAQCEKGEQAVLALERLLKNSAMKQYPMSDLTLRPASFPAHYDRIREGIEKGIRGDAKPPTFWSRFRWSRN